MKVVPRPLQPVVRRLRLDAGSRAARVAFRRDRAEFRRQLDTTDHPHRFVYGREIPMMADRFESAGLATGQYFLQDLYVAQAIFKARPRRHLDIGSRVDGFVTHVASFRPIEVMDLRPLREDLPNIRFVQRDIMADDRAHHGLYDSVSCLHALEHFGLGRYGDPIRADGWLIAWDNLARLLEEDGLLYLSAPIGTSQRVEFNAHRVFALPTLLDVAAQRFSIEGLAVIDDVGRLHARVDPTSQDARGSLGCSFGLAILTLRLCSRASAE